MWRYTSASVIGSSHATSNTPCQDYSHVTELPDPGMLFLVCSDGAGSASHSELGSQITCRTFADTVTDFVTRGGTIADINRETVLEWLTLAQSKLEIQAAALDVGVRELACTLIGALLSDDTAVFFQVGDGAAVTVSEDANYRVVFWPDQGEYVNTTYFVTAPDAAERLQVDLPQGRVRDVALFTDGLQSVALKFDSKSPHEPFFAPMFARLRNDDEWRNLSEQVTTFLGSDALNKRTDDDRTLVLASRV